MTLAIEWARPHALWALLLAIPLAAFSLYRLKRRRVVVAFLPLLQETAAGARAWSGWKRLSEVGSLVARTLALAAAVLALAGPRPDGDPRPPETLVLVLDGDVTTQALESPDETRFQRQVNLAKAHVRAHPRGPVAIVHAGASPRVPLSPSEDREAAIAAFEGLESFEGSVNLAPAITVALDLARRAERARILVLSSRELPAPPADAPSVPIEARGSGLTSDDQGFVDLAITPAADGVRSRIRWSIRNFDSERHEVPFHVKLDGRVLVEKNLSLEPRATVEETVDALPPKSGGYIYASLQRRNALTANDLVLARLPGPRRPSVLVVHGKTLRPFVPAVLDALGEAVDREGSGTVRIEDLAGAEPRDVTILDGVEVLAAAGTKGPTLYLAPLGGAGLPFRVGRAVEKPLVWRTDAGHPLLRGVDLSTTYVTRATPIEGEGVRGLAYADSAVVVAEGGEGASRWIAFGLDPEGSDLPLRAALPVLVKNAIRLLGEGPDALLRPFYRTGEPLRPRIEVDRSLRVHFDNPLLRTFEVPLTPDLRAPPGTWLVRVSPEPRLPADRSNWTAVVDLDSARDVTPVRPPSPEPPPAPVERDVAPLWRRALVLAALGLLVLDLALVLAARRRPRAVVGAVPVRG